MTKDKTYRREWAQRTALAKLRELRGAGWGEPWGVQQGDRREGGQSRTTDEYAKTLVGTMHIEAFKKMHGG